ncbi:MAG: DUF2508 family protein [Oscillospiraceae bacterium]
MFKPKKTEIFSQRQESINFLTQQLKECERLLRCNEAIFDMTVEDALIEARIYEKHSLNKHYQYLLREIKELKAQELAQDKQTMANQI